ncbi:30S ribosomal protein S17 [Flagellatimonas centrodinii]|uniref:30S ribosomal protein S17 n=1 Tax=Flagellatimonas centrodinii TaxID=2806210 RepID=UPI001FEF5448|nr:30S ribosomal protein S17 [Flagellatimonas centrodinii]ULQ47331.1 30S ribosomal protein S17 [Flagellatimonas centrodinii]
MSEQQSATIAADRRIVGKVTSAKPNKTITVLVERSERHPLYGKFIRRSTKLHAHDENNECGEGDLVAIIETRPLSRLKRFKLVEVITKAGVVS